MLPKDPRYELLNSMRNTDVTVEFQKKNLNEQNQRRNSDFFLYIRTFICEEKSSLIKKLVLNFL